MRAPLRPLLTVSPAVWVQVLRQVHAACERNELSDLPRTVAVLRSHLDEPVVACAALFWVEKNLTLPQLYSARTYLPTCLPTYPPAQVPTHLPRHLPKQLHGS